MRGRPSAFALWRNESASDREYVTGFLEYGRDNELYHAKRAEHNGNQEAAPRLHKNAELFDRAIAVLRRVAKRPTDE